MYDACMYLCMYPLTHTHNPHTVQSCEQDHQEGRIARMAQTENGRRRSSLYIFCFIFTRKKCNTHILG